MGVMATGRAAAKARVQQMMQTPATVRRASVVLAYRMWDGSSLRCRVSADTAEGPIAGASPLEQQRRWIIRLPDGLELRAGDQITALGNVYGVEVVDNPTSLSVQTTVRAYMLYDAAGVPVYLRPNATARVVRSGAQVGPDSIDVRLQEPGTLTFDERGGRRDIEVRFPFGTDVRAEDDVLVLTYNLRTMTRQGPYEVEDAFPAGEPGLDYIRVCVIGFTI